MPLANSLFWNGLVKDVNADTINIDDPTLPKCPG